MTAVIDIACPNCGSTADVRKYDLGKYRCGECGRRFAPEDVRRS